jgi:hypothetical protein
MWVSNHSTSDFDANILTTIASDSIYLIVTNVMRAVNNGNGIHYIHMVHGSSEFIPNCPDFLISKLLPLN